MRIETFEGEDGWRVRLMGDNGEIIATTEAYDSHFNAQRAQKSLEDPGLSRLICWIVGTLKT
jgi:uncharacterized protein YegP (UPF0339 family)